MFLLSLVNRTEISDEAKDLVRHLLTVDPKKRYTAKQVLQHRWIAGNVASDKKFSNEQIKRLKMLQARKRLRRGVQMIIAVNKFADTVTKIAKELDSKQNISSMQNLHISSHKSPTSPTNKNTNINTSTSQAQT